MSSDEKVIYFAQTDFRGREVKFGIKPEDRTKHVYIIGKTGMGKSTVLENMAVQDIQNGSGMGFIDPHGKTAELLLDYIPPERIKDVVYFAPHDVENPLSFNVMEDVGKDQRHLVVSGLMASFKKIWPDVWSARMEYLLGNILLALLEYPDSTLLGVNRMLSDADYRSRVVANTTDPTVRAFWVEEFAKYSEKFATEAGAAIQNKIGQFTANPIIRNIIGQPKSSFDIRKIMDEKKILIMNLSKGRIGETNANLIGGMLITKIYLAAMSRANVSNAEINRLPNFYFYVDEFQSFANDTFADILSEARKYKLNLTIAHQYIEQMEEKVRDAVFGNVGTTIAFRVGPFDAEVLEKVFAPKFLIEDIVNLGVYQIYLTLMIDGVGSAPFSAKTLGPIPLPEVSSKEKVIANSRATFGHQRGQVEKEIDEWYKPVEGIPGIMPASPSGNGFPKKKKPMGNGGSGGNGTNGNFTPRPQPVQSAPVVSDRPAPVITYAQPPQFQQTASEPVVSQSISSPQPVSPPREQVAPKPNLKNLIADAMKTYKEQKGGGDKKEEGPRQNSPAQEPAKTSHNSFSNTEKQPLEKSGGNSGGQAQKPKELSEEELRKLVEVKE